MADGHKRPALRTGAWFPPQQDAAPILAAKAAQRGELYVQRLLNQSRVRKAPPQAQGS
jgi:hypothetical protein